MVNDFSRMNSNHPVQAGYNEMPHAAQPHHIHIEIALLDYTGGKRSPQLHEMHIHGLQYDENLKQIKQSLSFDQNEAFSLLGEVEKEDKKSKMLYLSGGSTVSYTHCITVTGQKPSILIQELSAGLSTLIDALRMGKEVKPALRPPSIVRSSMKKRRISTENNSGKNLKQAPLSSLEAPVALGLLAGAREMLYQIQL